MQFQQGLLHLAPVVSTGSRLIRKLFRPLLLQSSPASLTFLPVQALVHSNPIQPRRKLGLSTVPIQMLVSVDKGLLRQVVRVSERTGHAKTKRVNHALMLPYQNFKRAVIDVHASAHLPLLIASRDHPALIFTELDNLRREILCTKKRPACSE
jgi:hypothetical protein